MKYAILVLPFLFFTSSLVFAARQNRGIQQSPGFTSECQRTIVSCLDYYPDVFVDKCARNYGFKITRAQGNAIFNMSYVPGNPSTSEIIASQRILYSFIAQQCRISGN